MKLTSRYFSLILAGFGLSLLTSVAATPASGSQNSARSVEVQKQQKQEKLSCADWNTPKFAKKAKPADVARCLAAGRKVNERDQNGRTLLHRASKVVGKPGVVTILLKNGADPHARDKKGRVPLHFAGASMNEMAAALLVMANSDPNALDDERKTPLHHLASGYLSLEKKSKRALHNKFPGAELYFGDNRKWFNKPVKRAIGDFEKTFQVLVQAGADLRFKDEKGKTLCDRMQEIVAVWKQNSIPFKLSPSFKTDTYGLYHHYDWWDWPMFLISGLAGRSRVIYVFFKPEFKKACGGGFFLSWRDVPRSR